MSTWTVFGGLMVVLVLIAWPYGMPSDPDDPAFYYSRTWRPLALGSGLLLGLIALSSACHKGSWLGIIVTMSLLVVIITSLVGSRRAQYFLKKELLAWHEKHGRSPKDGA